MNQEHFPTEDRLNTDVLEDKYGPIHAVVLRHDKVEEAKEGEGRIREALLNDQENITRTYALTFLTYDRNDKELAAIDIEIREGGLIGETFRNHGYTVKKNVIDVFMIPVPEWMRRYFREEDEEAKARLTEFYAKKEGSTPLVYGVVLEVYSPDFKDPKEGIKEVHIDQINPPTQNLHAFGIPMDTIWDRLSRSTEKDEWKDLKKEYDQAKEAAVPVVRSFHVKIDQYLTGTDNH